MPGLTVRMRVDGARETIEAFNRLPPEASKALRERTLDLSETLARRVAAYARGDSGQSALMADTVKANKDRLPSITAGGSRRVGRNRKPAYKILFGSEFGANYLRQYRHHLGRGSYWFFATVEKNEAEIADAWRKVADDIEEAFSRG